MKGIVLAGGTGTGLHPVTLGVSKQLLPVYDKPLVYYPISVLMLAGIRGILIITTKSDSSTFGRLLGNGSQFGVQFSYAIQEEPKGIAQAFVIAESFIGADNVCLVLGDNLFYGQGFTAKLLAASSRITGATIFAYQVTAPERFGVIEFDESFNALFIAEKPQQTKSDYVFTGLYFYDNQVVEIVKGLKPSPRGELEITDINKVYMKQQQLSVELLGRGFAWLDTSTPDSLLEASHFVQTIERRQGLKISRLEEIAYLTGGLSAEIIFERFKEQQNTYATYLKKVSFKILST
ncbi:glucose-1-phosphate thymidylyltransferase RfbA [Pseudoalteromonas xiamenensis]